MRLTKFAVQAKSRLATQKDEDERLPIHWAISYNHLPIAQLLVSRADFDPDVQDGSGWTPLMIASSLKEGDELVDLLLKKEADVNCKSEVMKSYIHACRSFANTIPCQISADKFVPLHIMRYALNHLTHFIDSPPLHRLQKQSRNCPQTSLQPCLRPRKRQAWPTPSPPCRSHWLRSHGEATTRQQKPFERHRYLWIHGTTSW